MSRSGISADRAYLWRDPGLVWRRVLLERAAYRLLTCDRSGLNVGVGAGAPKPIEVSVADDRQMPRSLLSRLVL